MATPAVTPQAATAWDEQGNPVQAQQPAAMGATAWDEQGNPVQTAPAQKETDPDEIPETSYGAATWGAIKNLGKDTLGAVKGAAKSLDPRPQDPGEQGAFDASGIGGMLVYRALNGLGETAMQAHDIPAAIHDINNSADPVGTYAKIIQKTASQGAGQAGLAIATEGLAKGAGALAEGAEGAEEPGLVKQLTKGKNVAQPAAKAALEEAAGGSTGSLRDSLSEPIGEAETNAKELYKQIDSASGADIKGLGEKLRTVNRAIRQSVSDAEDEALSTRRDDILERMDQAKQAAIEKGVDPKVLDQADEEFKRMSALSDVERKVFKNPDIIEGNTAHGSEETVNIDKAVKALQKLQDSEKYGGPRLEQAFGKDGATKLLDKFYGAQRQGIHAMKMQKVAKWIAGAAGAGAAAKGIATLGGKSE